MVYYGLNNPDNWPNCTENKMCPQDLSILNPTDYQTILDACNGNPDCGDFRADRDLLTDECANMYSEYIEIVYDCVIVIK